MKRFARKMSAMGVLVTGLVAFVRRTNAQDSYITEIPRGAASLEDPDRIIQLIEGFIFWLGAVLGAVAVLVMLWAGFQFMTAGDSESRRDKAKKWLLWGVIGVVVSLFATVIVPLVYSLLSGGVF